VGTKVALVGSVEDGVWVEVVQAMMVVELEVVGTAVSMV